MLQKLKKQLIFWSKKLKQFFITRIINRVVIEKPLALPS